MEIWKEIDEFPGYEISNSGEVRRGGRILRQDDKQASLWRNGKLYRRSVKPIMREAFGTGPASPIIEYISEPGEEWKEVEWAPHYMVSNHKRLWSWANLRIVGKDGRLHWSRTNATVVDEVYRLHFLPSGPPTLIDEEWRESSISGILVSNYGRVFSTERKKIVLPQFYRGYLMIRDENKRRRRVHRLVAEAFIPNPEGKECVDHINEVKTDNRAANLRWCSMMENCRFYLKNHPELIVKGDNGQ